MEELLKQKEGEIDDMNEIIKSKNSLITELEKELGDLEERRRLEEEEERRRRELEELERRKKMQQRKWYIPVKGDPIDEMMAKYLNECEYYVPVKRLGEG